MSEMERYFKRLADFDTDDIYIDNHIHSSWTDGEGSVKEIAQRAEEAGLRQIAIAEHVRKDSAYFSRYCVEIEQLRRETGIDILIGFEAKIKNLQGDIDVADEVRRRAQIKIASVHRFPIGRKLYLPQEFKKEICQEIELELSIAAIKARQCNVLGHPGGMSLRAYGEFPLNFFEETIMACKKYNVAFELNSSYHLTVLEELKTLLKRHDIFVSIGSDAHTLDKIGSSLGVLGGIGIHG